jgi:hypothetical protein
MSFRFFLNKTKYGLWMRAVVQDREMMWLWVSRFIRSMWTFVRGRPGGLSSSGGLIVMYFMMGRRS